MRMQQSHDSEPSAQAELPRANCDRCGATGLCRLRNMRPSSTAPVSVRDYVCSPTRSLYAVIRGRGGLWRGVAPQSVQPRPVSLAYSLRKRFCWAWGECKREVP